MGWQDGAPVEAAPAAAWLQGQPINNQGDAVRAYAAQHEREAVNPTGSFLENIAAGAGRGVDRLALALEQGVKEIGNRTTVRGRPLVPAADVADVQRRIDANNQTDKPLLRTVGGVVGDVATNVAATAGLPMGTLKSQVAAGAGLGLAQPVGTDESRLKNVALGAGGAAVGNLALRGAAKVISPNTSPEVKKLIGEGVGLTPGQILGGGAKATEEKLTSVPILGDLIKGAQGRGLEDFNRAAYNRALKPIGESADKSFPVGREGLEMVNQKLSDAYNSLLPKLSFKADPQLSQEIASLRQMVTSGLPETQANQFDKVLREQLVGKMTPQGSMNGEALKAVEAELGRLSKGYRSDPAFDNRQLGDAIGTLQQHIRDNLARNNPAQAAELQKINEGYANYARLRDAGSRQGAEGGVFTPAQLSAAVRAGDKSVGKGDFAKGNALMQDLADPGKKVVANKYPDSGTAGRGLLGALAAGGAGAFANPAVPMGVALGAAAYTRPGQAALQTLLTQRPAVAVPISEMLKTLAPGAGAVGLAASPLLGQ